MSDLLARLSRQRVLVGDGAMGTALLAAGLPPGGCPEIWNLERPGVVESILRGYADAGTDLLQTNTFGGNPARLAAYGLAGRCAEINRSAAEMGRRVAADRALVVGSIGPTGALLQPLGPLSPDEALDGFRLQAAALAEGGADALCVETMTDLAEAVLAVRSAAATGLPVIASMTFESTSRGFFTVMGDDVSRAARDLASAGACVIGTNCGTGSASMLEIVKALRRESSLPILVEPNAGLPVMSGGGIAYPESPEEMASFVGAFVEAGASIIGGCCGTTPDHVRVIAREIRKIRERP